MDSERQFYFEYTRLAKGLYLALVLVCLSPSARRQVEVETRLPADYPRISVTDFPVSARESRESRWFRPISDSLNSHRCRAIISAAASARRRISSMSHQTHEKECPESASQSATKKGMFAVAYIASVSGCMARVKSMKYLQNSMYLH